MKAKYAAWFCPWSDFRAIQSKAFPTLPEAREYAKCHKPESWHKSQPKTWREVKIFELDEKGAAFREIRA